MGCIWNYGSTWLKNWSGVEGLLEIIWICLARYSYLTKNVCCYWISNLWKKIFNNGTTELRWWKIAIHQNWLDQYLPLTMTLQSCYPQRWTRPSIREFERLNYRQVFGYIHQRRVVVVQKWSKHAQPSALISYLCFLRAVISYEASNQQWAQGYDTSHIISGCSPECYHR